MSGRRTFLAGLFLLAALASGAAGAVEPAGRTLYLQNCAACHQPEGQGLGHPIPPLAGSPILLGEEPEVAGLVLHGKAGMPAFHLYLSDEVISAILSYARDAWGNAAPPISLALVAAERAKLGNDGFRIPTN
jgi:mono/diheme cytochrome c family protein